MDTRLSDLTLAQFRDAVASNRPTPGGGAVCATCASFGLGLVVMALEITKKHRTEPAERAPIDAALARARPLLAQLGDAADGDVRAFQRYMDALKRLRSEATPEAERARTEASVAAIESPLTIAGAAVHALEVARDATGLSTVHLLSDVCAGAELLCAAAVGVLQTVEMNLRGLDDEAASAAYRARRDRLARMARVEADAVRARADAHLAAHGT